MHGVLGLSDIGNRICAESVGLRAITVWRASALRKKTRARGRKMTGERSE